jgi:hypothetical protein
MEVTQETDALRSSWRYVLWCDGADFESWDSSSGSHTLYGRDEAAIARALTDLASRASSAAVVVPSLLLAAPARVPDYYAITLSVDPTTKLIHAALFDLVPGISAIRDPTFRITLQPRANPALDADSFHFEVPLP